MKLVTTTGVVENKLRVIDAREVKGTRGLHLAHGEAERPRVGGKIIDDVIGEIGAVHLGYDIVVIDIRGVLEKSGTVDVKGRGVEIVLISPTSTSRLTRDNVKRLHRVVKVAEVNIGVGVRSELVLSLCDENLMILIGKELSLIGIEINVVTIDLGGFVGGETIAALDTNLNIVILEGNEGKRLGPILPEEENLCSTYR